MQARVEILSRPSPAGAHALTGILDRGRAWREVLIVLALSLIPSSLVAVVALVDRLTRSETLAQQTATLNAAVSERWVFDLLYRSISICADLVVVLLALWLLRIMLPDGGSIPGAHRLGLLSRKIVPDAGFGLGLAVCIGIPGLGLYLAARALGLAPQVVTNADTLHPSTVIILLLAALRAALIEEVIVVGYLMTRLSDLDVKPWVIIAASALLRGSYHLYQGVPMGLGNVAMGLLCAVWFRKTGRVGPLIAAHFLLDAVSFLGLPLAQALWPGLA
ncbi:CPBP family intramembrane metalloprotease [Pseudoclavibacter alba]|uniref:CPBP family intramembrane metalloprotease n=1 Tax=Pseudoclavibacter albus TaxID=272241 RepID=A0ABT2HWQ2_9MICO|nr:CPBP family intramembrane glutamic endopeptidase [Pseudoclavibacter alba]MCT2042570.1 CPBP family intramembrane metalloprotease [Pseudoclavibacter alba]